MSLSGLSRPEILSQTALRYQGHSVLSWSSSALLTSALLTAATLSCRRFALVVIGRESSLTGVFECRRLALELVSRGEFWCKLMLQASPGDLWGPGVDRRLTNAENLPENLAKLLSGTKVTACSDHGCCVF